MPEIGEVKYGKEIGLKSPYQKHIWHACEICGKERWVQCNADGEPRHLKCRSCGIKTNAYVSNMPRGALNCNWRGGRSLSRKGYVNIMLQRDDFFFPMATKWGQVLEHRLVVAKALGRCLQPWEHVHHKHTKYPAGSREDKQDNRYPENLSLEFATNHKQITTMENKIKTLERKIKELEAIIASID